ncbi:MAG: four helix bundle protein [bacterium]
MRDIKDAPVFQLTFDILKDFHVIRLKFPKTEKYSLGGKIEETLLSTLILILEAGYAKRQFKTTSIERAMLKTDLTKVLIRLAWEIDALKEKQYLALQERLQRISQMLGGWKRSL